MLEHDSDLVVLHGVGVGADWERRNGVGDLLALALARHEATSLLGLIASRRAVDEADARRSGRRRGRLVEAVRPRHDLAVLVLVRSHEDVEQLLRLVVVHATFRLELLHHQRCNVTSQSLRSRYGRHFVGITRHNALCEKAKIYRVIRIKLNQLV